MVVQLSSIFVSLRLPRSCIFVCNLHASLLNTVHDYRIEACGDSEH